MSAEQAVQLVGGGARGVLRAAGVAEDGGEAVLHGDRLVGAVAAEDRLAAIKTFEKVSAQKLNYEITSRRSGDVEKVYADTLLANEELGWKAERNLENMLSTAWNWQLKLKDLKIK